jgi:hypothetical protein
VQQQGEQVPTWLGCPVPAMDDGSRLPADVCCGGDLATPCIPLHSIGADMSIIVHATLCARRGLEQRREKSGGFHLQCSMLHASHGCTCLGGWTGVPGALYCVAGPKPPAPGLMNAAGEAGHCCEVPTACCGHPGTLPLAGCCLDAQPCCCCWGCWCMLFMPGEPAWGGLPLRPCRPGAAGARAAGDARGAGGAGMFLGGGR